MIIKTLFHQNGKLEPGIVEVKLLPGIPHLHVVGLPDASIRECGIKLKSAIRSCGLEWPGGMQIIVSLRPMENKKSGAGVDLAIALGYLGATDQLPEHLRALVSQHIVYGELALNGEIFAPLNISQAMRVADGPVLTGKLQRELREGDWLEIGRLDAEEFVPRRRAFDWTGFWRRPDLPDLELHPSAARQLALAAHMRLHVLLAGPQGTGKTTWAKLLYAMSEQPELEDLHQREILFGESAIETPWRPLEQPHHTASTQAIIGGGNPIEPGLISRTHGGVLIMDEFLQFHPDLLEALREPAESGHVDIARRGARERFPAKFQLIGATNLCPCGKLNPARLGRRCNYSLTRCRSTVMRMSGPLLDRFDFLALTHEWIVGQNKVSVRQVFESVVKARAFAKTRPNTLIEPEWSGDVELNHRRRRSISLVARGLADLEASVEVLPEHVKEAFELVVTPMHQLREVFA